MRTLRSCTNNIKRGCVVNPLGRTQAKCKSRRRLVFFCVQKEVRKPYPIRKRLGFKISVSFDGTDGATCVVLRSSRDNKRLLLLAAATSKNMGARMKMVLYSAAHYEIFKYLRAAQSGCSCVVITSSLYLLYLSAQVHTARSVQQTVRKREEKSRRLLVLY